MREIKFRGYGKDDHGKHWIYGNLLDEKLIGLVAIQDEKCHVWEVDPESVGQFTGVRDRNKTEIYEGDILRKRDEFAWRTANTGAVFWNREEGRWCVWVRGGLVFSLTLRKGETWSVIGNMYDNPELLEVRKP